MIWILFSITIILSISIVLNFKLKLKTKNTYSFLKNKVSDWIKKQLKLPDLVKQEFPLDLEKVKKWQLDSDKHRKFMLYTIPVLSICFFLISNSESNMIFQILSSIISIVTSGILVLIKVIISRFLELKEIEYFYIYHVDMLNKK